VQGFVICGFYIPFKKSDGKDELVKLLDRAAAKNPKKLTAATAAKLTSNNDLPEIETDLPSSPSQFLSPSQKHVEFYPDKSLSSGVHFENEVDCQHLQP
jgi:hypothetical protein